MLNAVPFMIAIEFGNLLIVNIDKIDKYWDFVSSNENKPMK
jgi:hypothetical protein